MLGVRVLVPLVPLHTFTVLAIDVINSILYIRKRKKIKEGGGTKGTSIVPLDFRLESKKMSKIGGTRGVLEKA